MRNYGIRIYTTFINLVLMGVVAITVYGAGFLPDGGGFGVWVVILIECFGWLVSFDLTMDAYKGKWDRWEDE